MSLRPGTVASLVGAAVFVALFPTDGMTGCGFGEGCTSTFETFWGMPLPAGAWSSLPALGLGSGAAWVAYRKLRAS
jgi:hypothetical protein